MSSTFPALLIIGAMLGFVWLLKRIFRNWLYEDAPEQPKLHVVQAGDMLLFNARSIPRELVFNQNIFRLSASQLAQLPAVTAHIWIFSEEVLREIAAMPTPAPLLWHLNDGRRSAGRNYLYARKGLLTDAEEAKLAPHAEVTWSVDLIGPKGRMDLEEMLAAAQR